MNRILYRAHRWVALVALAQLAVWTSTGLFFSLVPLPRVRGDDTMTKGVPAAIDWERVQPLAAAFRTGATEVLLRMVDGRPAYEVRDGVRPKLIAAETGMPIQIDAETATRIARAAQLGAPAVRETVQIEEAPIEYRDKPIPAWRVDLEDGRGTRVYVDARVGVVTARRNNLWRLYDFLWSLHIMDYRGRDNFNSFLLLAFAVLGVATVATGAVIWVVRGARRLRTRRLRFQARVQEQTSEG